MMKISFEIGAHAEADATRLFQKECLFIGGVFKDKLGYTLPTFGSIPTFFKAEKEEAGIVRISYLSVGFERFMHARLNGWKKQAGETTWQMVFESEDAVAIGPDAKLEFKTLRAAELTDIFAKIAQELSAKHPEYEIHYYNDPAGFYRTYQQDKITEKRAKAAKKPS
jgi:hypothetical protein